MSDEANDGFPFVGLISEAEGWADDKHTALTEKGRKFVRSLAGAIRSQSVVIAAADKIRTAQRAYMQNRGDDTLGKLVAQAADEYDRLRSRALSERGHSRRDRVRKTSGYKFEGTIVSRFETLAGKARCVVDNGDGLLHIFNVDQLEIVAAVPNELQDG
jgi:hypothetical protein